MPTDRLSPEDQLAVQAEKLLLFSRATVAPMAERHAAIARLQSTPHHLSLTQIYSQIGPMSTLCRLEENQALLLQLSTAVSKLTLAPVAQDADATQALLQLSTAVSKLTLAQAPMAPTPVAQTPATVDAEAVAFRKSWLFRLWRFFAA
jgi:hypothetical protein